MTISWGYQNYLQVISKATGKQAQSILAQAENKIINDLSALKFSIYSTRSNELKQVRNDIMVKFTEEDFQSITIQPQASFIDTLLFDSKLKDFMNSSNLNKSNKSLLNKMKLYLPNELLISFLADLQAMDQIIAIEDYLQENGYSYLNSNVVPSVKSNIKHYYYDKAKFSEIMQDYSNIINQRDKYIKESTYQNYLQAIILIITLLLATIFIQVFDFYLKMINQEKINFLLKGHISQKKYFRNLWWKKSLTLMLSLVCLLTTFIIDFQEILNINIDTRNVFFIIILIATNLAIFILKKERTSL
jgi:hypothetical protein